MPNRILREGLLDSEPLSKSGEKAEVLFMRLLLVADDFGRFDGRLSVICRRCWPLGEPTDPNEMDVLERLTKLTEHKLVVAYEVDGKPFIFIPKFKQRTRASKSKFPDPPANNPQLDRPMTDNGQSPDGQPSDSRARSSSFVVRNSDSGGPVDKSQAPRPSPNASSIAKTQHQLAAQARMREEATTPPADFASRLPPNLRKAIEQPPPHAREGGDDGEQVETLDT
jgi:hypothetical protein